MKRHKVSRRGSKRLFKRTGAKVHKMNAAAPMRGGIRL